MAARSRTATPENPLGPLASLVGNWEGTGFNQIWRPFPDPTKKQDTFLEINSIIEQLQFRDNLGEIPNRGLFTQPDISLFGLTYLQQISDANVKGPDGKPAGLHVEPGLWVTVPPTEVPTEPATIARMGSIPHGTTINVQGVSSVIEGPPTIPNNNIVPFKVGDPSNPLTTAFSEMMDLSKPSDFRSPPEDIPNVTQETVNNPNSLLQAVVADQKIISTTVLQISTAMSPNTQPNIGGGTSNIAFLRPNADAVQVDATFWIETVAVGARTIQQLQYTQRVLLNFNGLSWPHITVATLKKTS